ncbi:ATP-binding protein [Pelagibacterales bacterium]|nr:ATP-binding protein [Pelagibacterales bacterium]
MFSKITRGILTSWRFSLFIVTAIVLIASSFFILLNQRSTISSKSNIDELLVLVSAMFIFAILIIFIYFIYKIIIPINKRKVTSFNNKFSLYFISMALTPAIVAGILGLVLVNFGINDWFNDKIKSVINNSLNVAKGYVEEHNNSIKSDIYAMSHDLNRNYNVYINNRFKFEKYFEEQSAIRSLPEAYLIDNNGEVLMSKNFTIFTQYYRPNTTAISKATNGELAIMTSTKVNKVYALIRLPNFINAYLYVGRPLDPKVTKAFDDTKSAVNEYSVLESNRTQIAIVFMLIYILIILILIFISTLIGLRFAKRIVEPIANVINATDSIKKGSYNISLPKTNEFIELNRLTESFNTMSSELSIQRNMLASSEKHAAWSEIAKTIAHEIKNPLTPIQLSNDRIRKKLELDGIDDQTLTDCLDIISRQVNDIGKLVNNFSDFARMPKPIFKPNNLTLIISECIQAKSLLCEGEIKISLISNDDIQMNCDKLQLTQVFNNIIQNSINSILENKITNGFVKINLSINKNQVVITIEDNGIGIVNSKSELIEPYFTTRKKSGGTGLGLSIVNKILTDHNGIFELANVKNNGVCAKIIFNNTL